MLLALFTFFVAMFAWAWRPGSRKVHDAAARSIFAHDSAPLPTNPDQEG
jgi:cytochrome c oxidase cbb3-type subunit 4